MSIRHEVAERNSVEKKVNTKGKALHPISEKQQRLLKHVNLCRACLKRQGISARVSPKIVGALSKNCEICHGLILRLPSVAKDVRKKLKSYQFDTFLVGTSVPQEVLDREDEIRSRFKIRGLEGIKTQISRTIGREISSLTGKKVDYARPDLTLLVSLGDGSVVISPRSIWLSLRYLKNKRGLAQRSSVCRICNGLGCAQCDYRGSNRQSIQTVVEHFLSKKFEAEGCAFIWIGSEDEKSLVGGGGRPFYVEIQKPRKRRIQSITRKKIINFDGVSLSSVEAMNSRPISVPQFRVKCLVNLTGDSTATGEPRLQKEAIESSFRNAYVQVRISRKDKIVTKKVHSILVAKGEAGSPHLYVLKIDCDGGIPIRRLVLGGDDSVTPNLSHYMEGLVLDRDAPFDIEDVSLIESRPVARREKHGRTKRKALLQTNRDAEEIEGFELV